MMSKAIKKDYLQEIHFTSAESCNIGKNVSENNVPLKFISGGVWTQDKNYLVERQNYNTYLLLYTIRGKGLLRYEGKQYPLFPRTMFLIDCNRYHVYGTANDQWDFCFIHFHTDILREYLDVLYENLGAVFTISDGAAMESRMRKVLSLFSTHDPMVFHRAFGMIADILGILHTDAQNTDNQKPIREETTHVIEIIEDYHSEKLTLDRIAREIGCSKYYLAHQFKNDTGIAIYAYLTLFRISKAKGLLENTNMSVESISEQVGFASVSNFIRTFSEYETTTPYQYRKRWQRN